MVRRIMTTTIERGMAEGLGMFGAPLAGMELRWVNGKMYRRLVPIVGAKSDRPPPPGPVLWLASRLHPAFRKQERLAKESFAVKRWRLELARWESEWKPRLVARNTELTDVPVADLDDAALADHLEAVHDHVLASAQLHHRLHVSDMGPLGLLMVALRVWCACWRRSWSTPASILRPSATSTRCDAPRRERRRSSTRTSATTGGG